MKKTQTSPAREIAEAKKPSLQTSSKGARAMRINSEKVKKTNDDNPIGPIWREFRESLLTPEEIAASNIRLALIGEIIRVRRELGITQKQLEELSGVKQPIISRIEKGSVSPNLETVIKVLLPLGKTIYVGDLHNNSKSV